MPLVSLLFLAGQMAGAAVGQFADYPAHVHMPPVPNDPAVYESKWDPFVLRSDTGQPLPVEPDSTSKTRMLAGFDRLPWNGRQIARDSAGNWYVLIEHQDGSLYLATAAGTTTNPYRPRGGDLPAFPLLGPAGAVLTVPGQISRASMVIDGADRLHLVWHTADGLWHSRADLSTGGVRDADIWSTPRRLVEGECRAGDIMVGPAGEVVISYARDDAVYYQPVSGGAAESVAAAGAGLTPLEPRGDKIPVSQRQCQDVFMHLAPDGTLYLVFRRDFCVWVARRTPGGQWQAPELVAREYAFHPSIMVARGRPLVVFLHDGIKRIPLDLGGDLTLRAGGGSALAYATLTDEGWRVGTIVRAEEIVAHRRGMWEKMHTGRVLAQIEQLGWPVLFSDRHGVVWALWQNTTRRWTYCARWLGEGFGDVQECRGPFNAPALPVNAEKHAPANAPDVGLLFYAAAAGANNRVIFDRLAIPSLTTTDQREVLFLDCLEVAQTVGADFRLNQMNKPIPYPALSPRPGTLVAWNPSVTKRGDLYVMRYTSVTTVWDEAGQPSWAISRDGVHFEPVGALPEGLPDPQPTSNRPLAFWNGDPSKAAWAYYTNPDQTDPAKKFVRLVYSTEDRGKYWVEYSPDGQQWGEKLDITAVEAMRERGRPNLYDPSDPERPIRLYSRVYTETGRSWGVIWTKDLVHWSGLEHLLDPDDPYGTAPAQSTIGTTGKFYNMRGMVYLDSVAGKGEDQIYASSVRFAEGLYFCFYWPGRPGQPLTDVGVAVSRDGFNFTRVKNGERILPLGPPGAWDSGYIFQMSPMVDGDLVRVYYRGTAARREGSDDFYHYLTEIGVATIRVNGFTYYTPRLGTAQAMLTTIPVNSPADVSRALAVNVKGISGHPGAFAVEVLDAASGQPIAGYAAADCLTPTEDGIAAAVSWRGGATLPTGRQLQLRFHLRAPGVRLYSFGFRDATPTAP